MLAAPIVPLSSLANVDLNESGFATVPLAYFESVNCAGTPAALAGLSDVPGALAFTWGWNGDIYAEFAPGGAQVLSFLQITGGYTGTLSFTSRIAGAYGSHTYVLGLHTLQRDGAPFAIDWTNQTSVEAAVNELYDALLATYAHTFPSSDCIASRECIAVLSPTNSSTFGAPDWVLGIRPLRLYVIVNGGDINEIYSFFSGWFAYDGGVPGVAGNSGTPNQAIGCMGSTAIGGSCETPPQVICAADGGTPVVTACEDLPAEGYVAECCPEDGGFLPNGGILVESPQIFDQRTPWSIVTGPDGNLWFTEVAGNKIGRITTSGAVTEYPIPTRGAGAVGIVKGPDGNLWFTETAAGKIGRMATSGIVTEFALTNRTAAPLAIVTSTADGNLWFTENGAAKIGRITPGGTITEFPITSPAFGIAQGSDQNLWFTEPGVAVGKITTAGVAQEFPTTEMPGWLAAGSDGNLWATDQTNNAITKITTAGLVTEFPVPTLDANLQEITAGSDGNLWFVENSLSGGLGVPQGKVAKITTAGVVTEYLDPSNSGPGGLVFGPDGDIWCSETYTDTIEQIVIEADGGSVGSTFTIPGTAPGPLAKGSDGRIYFALNGAIEAVAIDGGTQLYPFTGLTVTSIAPGPDGNVWFTDQSSSMVRSMSPTGASTTYPFSGGPNVGMTAGPDGNMWIASGNVTKLQLDGGTTTYAVPGANAIAITSGPDGNLWFTEPFANDVGRVTPAGTVTEFPVPTQGALPWGIVAGTDGKLWFTELSPTQIATIDPSTQVIVERPVPAITLQYYTTIAWGSDHDLWFSAFGAALEQPLLVRMTPAGVATAFLLTNSSGPTNVVAGASGDLWFSDYNDSVARVLVP
jgi:streptogramin lyase